MTTETPSNPKYQPKSRLFSFFDPRGDEDFRRDTAVLETFDPSKFSEIPGIQARIMSARGTDRRKEIEREAKTLEVTVPDLIKVVAFAEFLSTHFQLDAVASRDDPSVVTNDMIQAGILTEGRRDAITRFIAHVKDSVDKEYRPVHRMAKARVAGAPVLRDVDYAVDVRPVFSQQFERSTDLDGYGPSLDDSFALVLLTLNLKGSHIESVTFQVDRDNLRYLRDVLTAAEREIEIAESKLHFDTANPQRGEHR